MVERKKPNRQVPNRPGTVTTTTTKVDRFLTGGRYHVAKSTTMTKKYDEDDDDYDD